MATLKQVTNEIMDDLSKLDGLTRFVGIALHSETLDRIFTKGIDSSGSSLGTYSNDTISLKKSQGHFTSNKVNLRNTDQLANSYIFQPKGKEILLGFRNINRNDKTTNAKVIQNLEKQYGDIFGLTSKEDKLIDDLIEDYTDKIF